MAKNEKEYAELVELRKNLTVLECAQAEYDKAKKRLDSYTFKHDPPESIVVDSHTRHLIKLFESPTINAEKAKAAKRDKPLNFLKNLFLIAVAIGVLLLGIWLIKLSAVWSWNTSITDMVTDIYMTEIISYDIAVGIHLFALFLVLAVAAIICGALAMSSNVGFSVGSVAFGLCGAASLIVSFKYFYSEAEGFWSGVTYFFSALLYTPKLLKTLVYIFPFILAVFGTVAGVSVLLYLCTKGVATKIDTYERPNIDLSALKATAQYKEAERKDLEATEKARAEYRPVYENAVRSFNEKRAILTDDVNKFVSIYNSCLKKIKATRCVPEDKKTLKWVGIILYYIEEGTARDSVEALREYKIDCMQEEMKRRLDELEAHYQAEVEKAYNSGYRKARSEAEIAFREVKREFDRREQELIEAREESERALDRKMRDLSGQIDHAERQLRYTEEEYRLLRNAYEWGVR